MADLIECKTCKQMVSRLAKQCPHCGAAIPGAKTHKSWLIIILIIVLLILFSVALGK
ncbi:MAG: hypothetical protein ACU84H_01305 [Gammaproteobacteria bacterium]